MSLPPDDRVYSQDHLWLQIQDDSVATIGITEFAQSELGDIVFVEQPVLGNEYQTGEICAVIESVKTASDVYMPVHARVVDLNQDLEDSPEIMNDSPYERGWLCKVELFDKTVIDSLLDASQYEATLSE